MNQEYYKKIISFFRHNKRMPSYAEIMEITGLKSKSSVYYAVQQCIEKGFLAKDNKGKLIPKKLSEGIRVLGSVAAGFPGTEEQEESETMTLDDMLITNKDASFLLKVKGDSMKGEGIKAGDLVFVERTNNISPGDIVVASVDGEWTVKFLRKKRGAVFLEAANPNYPPIYPDQELHITFVVRAVIRQY